MRSAFIETVAKIFVDEMSVTPNYTSDQTSHSHGVDDEQSAYAVTCCNMGERCIEYVFNLWIVV